MLALRLYHKVCVTAALRFDVSACHVTCCIIPEHASLATDFKIIPCFLHKNRPFDMALPAGYRLEISIVAGVSKFNTCLKEAHRHNTAQAKTCRRKEAHLGCLCWHPPAHKQVLYNTDRKKPQVRQQIITRATLGLARTSHE